jgi:hypothetical protein
MPQSALVQTAQSIADELNAHTFTLRFTAERSYRTDLELEDLDTLHVDVVPVNAPSELASREVISYDCSVDIAVRKKFEPKDHDKAGEIDRDEIDRLMLLVQEVHEFLVRRRLTTFEEAAWQSTDIRLWYFPRHLREFRQFTGLIRVVFRVNGGLG